MMFTGASEESCRNRAHLQFTETNIPTIMEEEEATGGIKALKQSSPIYEDLLENN